MPTALRIPDAYTRRPLPSGESSSTVGAILLGRRRVGIVVVGSRSDRHEHPLAVARERDVTRPVTAAAQVSAARQVGHDGLRRTARLGVAALVRQPHDGVRVGDVEPARIADGRIERDPERLIEALGEDARPRRLPGREQTAEHANDAGLALDHERVAVRRDPEQPGLGQAVGVELYLESGRRQRPGILRALDDVRRVVDRPGHAGRRQIGGGDPHALARALGRVVGERAGRRGFRGRAAAAGDGAAAAAGTGTAPAAPT